MCTTADHTMGLVPLLRNILGFAKPPLPPSESPESPKKSLRPRVDIYGPKGVRELIRTLMTVTHTRCGDHYAVHELLNEGETSSAPNGQVNEHVLHPNELPGSDIYPDVDGFWRGFTQARATRGEIGRAHV